MPTPENAIFICYRRADSQAATQSIWGALSSTFGQRAVFFDHKDFRVGEDWRRQTKPILAAAKAMVVILDDRWVDLALKRLGDPDDAVRQELELALGRDDLPIVPLTIGATKAPADTDAERFRPLGDDVVTLLAKLFAKTSTKVRFDNDFEFDIAKVIRLLDDVPGIDPVGQATSFDVGGLQVVRPWNMASAPPKFVPGKRPPSDLWVLKPKYRSVEMVGRERDFADLLAWRDDEARVAARLIVGRAGTGKTRLAMEFVWRTFREAADRWDAGFVVSESLRMPRDWNEWRWLRPTILVLDYAQALDDAVRRMLLALARKAEDENLAPLRLLLLERQASAEEGWFRQLLDMDNPLGGGPVRELFLPPEPVALQPLESLEDRRGILQATLHVLQEWDGKPVPRIPAAGADPGFDAQLAQPQWREPLYLMMAALVGRTDAQGRLATNAEAQLLAKLTLERTDLAEEVAGRELSRLDHFVVEPPGRARIRLLHHMTACATLCGGMSGADLKAACAQEGQALGLQWPEGYGDLAALVAEALPGGDGSVAPVEPDIVGEALVLRVLGEGLSRAEQSQTILRLAHRNVGAVSTTLFHAFASFGADDQRTATLLCWIAALIESGLNENHAWLEAIENSFPHQTTVLRDAAVRVTQALYDAAKSRLASNSSDAFRSELAGMANNLACRLKELGRRQEALKPALEAVHAYTHLAKKRPDLALPDLVMSLNNISVILAELGQHEEASDRALQAMNVSV